MIIPEPPTLDPLLKLATASTSIRAVRPRDWLSHLVLGALFGALTGSGISLVLNPPLFLRGDGLWHSGSNSMLDWIFALSYRTVLSVWGIMNSEGKVELRWPAWAGDVKLHQATQWGATDGWLVVTATPMLHGDHYILRVDVTDTGRFFRLL